MTLYTVELLCLNDGDGTLTAADAVSNCTKKNRAKPTESHPELTVQNVPFHVIVQLRIPLLGHESLHYLGLEQKIRDESVVFFLFGLTAVFFSMLM